MALRLDLNSPPLPADGASTFINPQNASAGSSKGLIDSPIDVEALDDEVQLLPSSATFPQRRNHQRRRNDRLTIDLEQAAETTAVQSGVSVIEPAAILLSLSSPTNHERTSTKRKYIIQHPLIDVEEYAQTKSRRENAMYSSHKEPKRVVAAATSAAATTTTEGTDLQLSCMHASDNKSMLNFLWPYFLPELPRGFHCCRRQEKSRKAMPYLPH
ncbi:uncharacterized protein A4U43_C10F5060 [Asparagus officinalis]|uniref:Uncharacterized protein n=1 Tax=Asparagus officinalis TaxID=4686 RepID=A0A5P1E0S6_ASPOF|nr:uncharacterized protein LOC109825881 [Asparagus officinalis]ONK56190.1 uncharacterized protein A4U43_C10F5060 [Asparagus officinalis]